jgi:ABC-type dipeptide/oligopeptide/nickel transport system ATPase subunit
MYETLRLQHPFTCIISGPTGSGKSTFCIKFLQNLKALCKEPTFRGGIIWCYSEKTAVPHEQLSRLDNKNIRFHKRVPENFNNVKGEPSIIILDDLLNDVYSKDVCVLFTRGGHHRNMSVILITQNLFHQRKHCRDISLNAKYLVLLKNVRDKNKFTHLARQVYPENSSSLLSRCNATTPWLSPLRPIARLGRPYTVSNQCISL